MRKLSKLENIFLFFMALTLLLPACQKKEQSLKEVKEVIPVRVMEVKLKDLDRTLDYVGSVKAQDEVVVYPKVGGKIIEKIKEDGSPVERGEVIAYIDRDEVGSKYEKAPVESPLSGIVGRVYVDIGSNVTAQVPVALVVNMDRVKINLDIPEKYLPEISLGQNAGISVDSYPNEEFAGRVSKISPVLDLNTRSVPIEISIDNPGHRLKSGMFARVKLAIEEHKNVPVILKESVIGRGSESYAYVIENNKAVLRKISLGIQQDSYFEVSEGIKEKDLVVIMGQQRLYENAEVIVEKEENPGASK